MKKLFGTTALALIISGAALAQTATTPPASATPAAAAPAVAMQWLAQGEAQDVYASDIIGATLYAAEDGRTTLDARNDWESVGTVNDVLLSRDGQVRAVLVDVGTFLGMGGKTVASSLEAVSYVSDGEDASDYFLVIAASRDTLNAAPAYVRPDLDANTTSAAAQSAGTSSAAPMARNSASESMFEHDGYTRAPNEALTVDDLKSAAVYDRDNTNLGTINELLVGADGKITDAVVDVGGFLGMGARPVSMKFDDLTVLRQDGGDDLRIYVDATKETLEAMPAYEK